MSKGIQADTEDLGALREFALEVSGEMLGGGGLSAAEEAFAAIQSAAQAPPGLEDELSRQAEAGYRKAILLYLRYRLAHMEREVTRGEGRPGTEAKRMVLQARSEEISTRRFLELARAAKALIEQMEVNDRTPSVWVERIHTTIETFEHGRSEDWNLTGGAKVSPFGDEGTLEIEGTGRAIWTGRYVGDGRVDLRFRPGAGAGLVLLRASSEGEQAYILRLEPDRLTLERKKAAVMYQLGTAALALDRDEWYDISVWLSGGCISVAVDARPMLDVNDGTALVRPGLVILEGERSTRATFRDIRLTAVPFGTPLLPNPEPLALPLSDLSGFEFTTPFVVNKGQLTLETVPLEVKPMLGPKRPAPINAGEIPSGYTHTWGLDVTGFDSFFFDCPAPAPPPKIKLDWQAGDSLTVLDYSLPDPVVERITSETDLNSKWVSVQPPAGGGYGRIYLQLSTGAGGSPRRFQLSAIQVKAICNCPEALLVGDDLNYYQPGPMIEGKDSGGQSEKLYAPWLPYSPGVPTGVFIPSPLASKGWYLLARNFSNREPGFFSLLYYNELTSRVRAYLYNLTLSTDATYYQVTLSFAGRTPGASFVALNGAFFNADPRPQRWSTASYMIPFWPPKSWAFVEAPLLYPMAQELPGAPHPPDPNLPAQRYRPIYEEMYEKGCSNIKLVVTVQGYQVGTFQGDLVGEAIGEAVQKAASSDPSGFDYLKQAASALSTGKDYYDKGKSFYESMQDFLKQKLADGTPQTELQGLQALVGLGAGAFGGFLGLVGLGIGIYQAFFAKTEPLRLAIELTIRGKMSGSMYVPLMPREHTFFLPGRWSIEEAAWGNYPVTDAQRLDGEIARYDRTMGHFGFRYHPAEVKFRLLQFNIYYSDDPPFPFASPMDYTRFILPSKDRVINVDPPSPNAALAIPEWLPVIYNPYAEIVPLQPMPVATAEDHGIQLIGAEQGGPEPWFDWLQDVSPESHITPEPDDKAFPRGRFEKGIGSRMFIKIFPTEPKARFYKPLLFERPLPEGIWLSIPPEPRFPLTTCRTFHPLVDLPTHTWWDVAIPGRQPSWGDLAGFGADAVHVPFPMRDVIYYWDIAYFHYPRTRQAANGDVPLYRDTAHLLSPVSIQHNYGGKDYTEGDGIWDYLRPDGQSLLLLE